MKQSISSVFSLKMLGQVSSKSYKRFWNFKHNHWRHILSKHIDGVFVENGHSLSNGIGDEIFQQQLRCMYDGICNEIFCQQLMLLMEFPT
jgi:hypothetical protein